MKYFKTPLLFFFFAVIALIETLWILKSNGFYYIDECSHYLFSRFVLQSLPMTVETWHRPIPQWLFALPAQLGHSFTMFFAAGVFLGLLFLTYRIAVMKGITHAEWVIILVGLQPVLFDLSYAAMTEMPTALMITLSYYYYIKGKHGWSLLLASMVILCRTEMYLFAGVMFLVFTSKREWKILPLVLVGPLLWIASTTIISGSIGTFFYEWRRFANIGKFIPGVSVTHYFANLQTTFGYAQALLFLAGIYFIYRAKKTKEYGIIYGTIALTLMIHTIAGAEIFHWTGSIGELRYVSVVGPFFGLVSVYALSELLEKIKSPYARLTFAVAAFAIVVFNCTLTDFPRRWPNYNQVVINLTKQIKSEYPDLTMLSNNATLVYTLDVPPTGGLHYAPLNMKTFREHRNCIILWDPFSSYSIFYQTELTKEKLLNDTTVKVLERYRYWNAEYLVCYKR